jgi:O-antigen/teichoic acid export membrane protein
MADTQMAANPSVTSVFDTGHLKADLKGRSVRGGAATILGQATRFALQIGSTMVLARLLAPKDFGLIAMVTAVTGFAVLFKDLGLSMATVQKAQITHAQISVLFWVNAGVSLLIAILTAAAGPVIAWLYGEPRLAGITLALSLTFVPGGLTVQHQALLQRQMRFKALAAIPVISMSIGALSAIVTALLGGGYWALVALQLTMSLTDMLGVWSACRWRPSLPARRAGVRSMLGFGANLTAFNVLNYLARNMDNILIGRVWGPAALGLYAKAYGLLMLPISQINAPLAAVAIPALSRLQDDPQRYRRHYCRAVNLIAYVTTPLTLGLAAVSEEIIRFVLGEQWLSAGRIFFVLAIAGVGQPVSNTTGWVYVSLGRVDRQVRWMMMTLPFLMAAFAIGLPWGAIGVAVAYAIHCHLWRIPCWWFACRHSPISLRDVLASLWRPVLLSLLMFAAMMAVRPHLASRPLLVTLLGCWAVGLLVLAGGALLWPGARGELVEIVRTMRVLRAERTAVARESQSRE